MESEADIRKLIEAIDKRIRNELSNRCQSYTPDFRAPEVFNVTTALIARQATLALEFASAPQIWGQHSAPLFLRAMADVHITLAWILLEPDVRSRSFIKHGLGQAVLELEHCKNNLKSATDEEKQALIAARIEADEAWIDSQQWHFLVEVNVGAWAGVNTRTMAEQADLLDFYNNVYTPFSQGAHSTWLHVGRYNTSPSENPLNHLVWMPQIARPSGGVWNLQLAMKYLDKSFDVFDVRILNRQPSSQMLEWLQAYGKQAAGGDDA